MGGAPPPGGEAPSVVDLVMSVRVFTLNPKAGTRSQLVQRSALFLRPQPRLNLFEQKRTCRGGCVGRTVRVVGDRGGFMSMPPTWDVPCVWLVTAVGSCPCPPCRYADGPSLLGSPRPAGAGGAGPRQSPWPPAHRHSSCAPAGIEFRVYYRGLGFRDTV